jgi:glycosyltransferase involved in cell wall biosynthesis
MKVLHVVPDARLGGTSRELDLLLTEAQSGRQEARVCCLAGDGPAQQGWRTAGVHVDLLAWRGRLDPRPLWALAAHLREWRPDVIHAWGLEALGVVRLAAPLHSSQRTTIVVRKPIPSAHPSRDGTYSRLLSRWERWLIGGADRILVSSHAEAARCVGAGIPLAVVRIVPPGAQALPPAVEQGKSCILCVGALQPHKGFFEAIWTFDILRFVNNDVELLMVGDGPLRGRLQEFAHKTGVGHRIHFAGEVKDTAPRLAQASVVWVPSLTDSGARAVLEAMAAGLPVVASRWPGLAELVVDGETGFLVEPGNKMDLARQTRRLLEDADLRRRLGEAARRRVEDQFSPGSFIDKWSRACGAAA